jgi:translation initiation factor 5A
MDTKNESAGGIKVGNYVVFDGIPCVVKSLHKGKTGKHGAAKCRIEAVGLFEEKKIIKVMPASDNVQVPLVEKRNAQVLSVNGNKANVMDLETYESFDLEITDEFKGKVEENNEVGYWTVLGKKILRQVK